MMRSAAYNRFGVLMGTSSRASSPRWLSLRGNSLLMITLISSQGDFCATAVWVFTDGHYVIFKLRETREASFVHDFLAYYQGTLISDFYAGYDAVPCRQQKCWAHLIRDLNSDLVSAPFDTEFERFVVEVRNLIIPIMET